MKLSAIDFAIILVYLAFTIIIGLVMKKYAKQGKGSYLLGGNKLPWYMLGLSNASGMFDISGTMLLVTWAFVYGLKSIWIPWLWPVFNQIFLMVYLSMWLRRSNATTGAEWIATRFGKGKGSVMSHNIVVVYALISCLGFLAYGFIGLGKFMMIFIPWEYVSFLIPFEVSAEYVPHVYGILFTLFAMFYAILGGMRSIVWADLMQYIIMTVSSIAVGVIAISSLNQTGMLNVPDSWFSPFFGWELNMDWSGIIDEVNQHIKSDGYSLFGIFMMMVLFKGILVSAAGPAPNYDMQKILSAKTPKEASLMSGFVSVVLMPVRYFMVVGFAVLGLLYYDELNLIVGNSIDFEQILPSAINSFIPVGLMGLLLAGLLAAFMSTFAGTLNAAQAYVVNDIYLKYINPEATNQKVGTISYIVGVLVVAVSIIFGLFAENVNSILQWIVSALWGSYVASNVIKWYWWRFNGHGYFYGMVSGLLAAMIIPLFFPGILQLYLFPVFLVISIAGCIYGTYKHPSTDEETLIEFYRKVRPWGFWKPIHEKVKAKYPDFEKNKDFKRDMFNILVGVATQTLLVILPFYIIVQQFTSLAITLILLVICIILLKKFWYDHLSKITD
ncbi:MAG: sodium:solute symporter family protein [Bacteroidales bacterium]